MKLQVLIDKKFEGNVKIQSPTFVGFFVCIGVCLRCFSCVFYCHIINLKKVHCQKKLNSIKVHKVWFLNFTVKNSIYDPETRKNLRL